MKNDIILELRDVHKDFGEGEGKIHVLKGIDLSIVPGDRLAVLGASGAGKSTLLHIMGTLEKPTSGRIFFGKDDITEHNEEALAKIRNRFVGFVFQFHHLLPEFSALENVMMPALVQGIEKKMAEKMARAVLEEVGLGHRVLHRPGELSGGEQQRVAVARALVLDPLLLLADEPSGNLDSETGRKIQELLVGWSGKKGRALIVATHDESFAGMIARQLRIKDGKMMDR